MTVRGSDPPAVPAALPRTGGTCAPITVRRPESARPPLARSCPKRSRSRDRAEPARPSPSVVPNPPARWLVRSRPKRSPLARTGGSRTPVAVRRAEPARSLDRSRPKRPPSARSGGTCTPVAVRRAEPARSLAPARGGPLSRERAEPARRSPSVVPNPPARSNTSRSGARAGAKRGRRTASVPDLPTRSPQHISTPADRERAATAALSSASLPDPPARADAWTIWSPRTRARAGGNGI